MPPLRWKPQNNHGRLAEKRTLFRQPFIMPENIGLQRQRICRIRPKLGTAADDILKRGYE